MKHVMVSFDPRNFAAKTPSLTPDEQLLADVAASPGKWFEILGDNRKAEAVAEALRALPSYPESGRGGERLEAVSTVDDREFIRYAPSDLEAKKVL